MRTKLATYAVAGALGLTGVAGAALAVPAVSYAATGDSSALESRVSSITSALAGLVSDGTITQAQADRVATTLAQARPEGLGHHGPGGRGGRGMHLEALEGLGITAEEVRAAAQAGKTLAQLAQEQGVGEDRVVDALVAAKKEHLAEHVAEGRLTQAEADEKAADLEARVTERMDEPIHLKGGHRGRHGEQAPSTTGTPSPAAPSPNA